MNDAQRGFFVIAGPQCAGKTTAKNYLYARYLVQGQSSLSADSLPLRNLVPLQEMRQLVMHEYGIHSAIFIDHETELEIIERDLKRLDHIIGCNSKRVYLDETSVFTLAHACSHGLSIDEQISRYRERLVALNAVILFLHTPPSLSWIRRKPTYQERVAGFPRGEAELVLAQYRRYLAAVHSGLIRLMSQLSLPTHEIDASGPVEYTLTQCARLFGELVSERGIRLVSRF